MPHNIVTVAGCPPDHPARLWYSAARALREAGLLLRKPPAGRLSVCEFNSDPVGGITASWEASVQLTGAPRHWMLANLTACAEGGSYDQPLSPSSYVNIKTAHTGEVRVREALRPALRRGKRRTAKRLTWCQRKTHFKNGSRLFLFAPERCDLLVVTVANHSSRRGGGGGQYTGVPGAVRTRAMFHELPTALRVAMETAAKSSARRFTQALLVTGYPCGQPKAKYKTISSAWVREGPCWVERWQELVAAGAVRALPERWARRGCSASAAVPWCAGVVVSPAASMCSSRPPLLPEPPPSRFNRTRAKRRCRGSWCEDIANASMPSGSASGRDPRAVPGSTGGGRAATAPGGIRVDEVVFGDARVAALARHTLRYYMVVPCGAAPLPIGAACEHGAAADARACATCLLFKDGPSEKWVAGLRSTDGLQFDGEPVVAFTSASLWEGREAYRRAVRTAADAQANHDHDQILTHNLALLPLNGSYIAIGGTHRNFLGARSRSAPASDGHERDHPRHGGVFIGKSPGWTLALPGSGGTAPHGASTVDDVAAEAAAVATVAMAGGAAAAAMEMSRRADDAFAGARRQHARVQALRAAGKSTGISPADSISALRLAEAEAARAAHAAAVAIAAEPPGVLVRGGQVVHSGRYLLFARANMASRGQRFVQIDGYDHAQGDVYFWAAQPNPVSAGTLLAVLPLVHRLRACVAISFSRDGRRWSRPLPLVACRAYGERGAHQPAAPAIIRRGDAVHIYINVDVPSIALDAFLPERDYRAIDARQPDGRLVRYTVPCRTLAAWTEEGLRSLRPSN